MTHNQLSFHSLQSESFIRKHITSLYHISGLRESLYPRCGDIERGYQSSYLMPYLLMNLIQHTKTENSSKNWQDTFQGIFINILNIKFSLHHKNIIIFFRLNFTLSLLKYFSWITLHLDSTTTYAISYIINVKVTNIKSISWN